MRTPLSHRKVIGFTRNNKIFGKNTFTEKVNYMFIVLHSVNFNLLQIHYYLLMVKMYMLSNMKPQKDVRIVLR